MRVEPPPPATSEAITRGIRIRVHAVYSDEHSEPARQHWQFHYTVTISNEGSETVQLVSRHWIITDATNHVQQVKGLGVVGRQPTLAPGESFEYTSSCSFRTPFGSMEGTYQMVTREGDRFDATIAEFALSGPYTLH